MVTVLVLSVIWWFGTRERLPDKIVIAGGTNGGSFQALTELIASELERTTGMTVEVLSTDGSVENRSRLASGEADFALISADTVLEKDMAVVTPVYEEYVHIIVRNGSGIESIRQLNGKRIIFGPAGSADKAHAEVIFEHYGIHPSKDSTEWAETYDLPKLPIVDAAIEITSMSSPGLRKLLGTGDYTLLPVDDAEAISYDYNFYTVNQIPRGIYSGSRAIPRDSVETLSSTARIAARRDASPPAVRAVLNTVFGEHLQREFPGLMNKGEAVDLSTTNWHPTSFGYLQPYAGIDTLATFLESLSAAKELFVAVIALLWLGWQRYRTLSEEERNQNFLIQKERLDIFVNRTLELDRQLTETTCTDELRELHRKTTELQHLALTELTEDDLRGDRMFSIFLEQSNSLCRKIENRLLSRRLLALSRENQAFDQD